MSDDLYFALAIANGLLSSANLALFFAGKMRINLFAGIFGAAVTLLMFAVP